VVGPVQWLRSSVSTRGGGGRARLKSAWRRHGQTGCPASFFLAARDGGSCRRVAQGSLRAGDGWRKGGAQRFPWGCCVAAARICSWSHGTLVVSTVEIRARQTFSHGSAAQAMVRSARSWPGRNATGPLSGSAWPFGAKGPRDTRQPVSNGRVGNRAHGLQPPLGKIALLAERNSRGGWLDSLAPPTLRSGVSASPGIGFIAEHRGSGTISLPA